MKQVLESARHVLVVAIAAVLAGYAAHVGQCEHEMFMIAAAIIGGEFGLARNGPSRESDAPRNT